MEFVEAWIHCQPRQPNVTLLIGFFQPLDGGAALSQPGAHDSVPVRRDVAFGREPAEIP